MSKQQNPTQPTPKPRAPIDSYAQAGRLARRLADLDAQEKQELTESPASIKRRFADKRANALDGQPSDVVSMVARMRAEQPGEKVS